MLEEVLCRIYDRSFQICRFKCRFIGSSILFCATGESRLLRGRTVAGIPVNPAVVNELFNPLVKRLLLLLAQLQNYEASARDYLLLIVDQKVAQHDTSKRCNNLSSEISYQLSTATRVAQLSQCFLFNLTYSLLAEI